MNDILEILAHIQEVKKSDLLLHQSPISSENLIQFIEALERYKRGEPLAYIVGWIPFFDCAIEVNASVLIPRPETEQWVSVLAENLKKPMRVLDLCTGSGAIGISLKKKCPFLEVVLADISQEALDVAEKNAKKNQVDVAIVHSDLFNNITGSFDLIVCNPPYISEEEWASLDSSVKDFEPEKALKASENGLYFYRRLKSEAPQFLAPSGQIYMEIGSTQGPSVKKLFQGIGEVHIEKDWSGHDRLVKVLVF